MQLEKRFRSASARRPVWWASTAAAASAAFVTAAALPRDSVLLVDELDYIMTKKQSVVYNLFDW